MTKKQSKKRVPRGKRKRGPRKKGSALRGCRFVGDFVSVRCLYSFHCDLRFVFIFSTKGSKNYASMSRGRE